MEEWAYNEHQTDALNLQHFQHRPAHTTSRAEAEVMTLAEG